MIVREKGGKDYINLQRTLFFKVRHYSEKVNTVVGWLDDQKDTSDDNIVFITLDGDKAIIDLNGRSNSFLAGKTDDLKTIINEGIRGELGIDARIRNIEFTSPS